MTCIFIFQLFLYFVIGILLDVFEFVSWLLVNLPLNILSMKMSRLLVLSHSFEAIKISWIFFSYLSICFLSWIIELISLVNYFFLYQRHQIPFLDLFQYLIKRAHRYTQCYSFEQWKWKKTLNMKHYFKTILTHKLKWHETVKIPIPSLGVHRCHRP